MTRVVGLTGGVASGKSTVACIFAELGVPVVDADALAREVVRPGRAAYRDLVGSFGSGILLPDRTIDRARLASLVFADPRAREQLNTITHPRIRRAAQRLISGYRRAGVPLIIYEAALLVETGYHRELDGLIVVSLPEEVQLERLMRRDGLDRESATRRLRAQLPLKDKLKVADFVIDSSGSLAQLRQQVARVWRALLAGRSRRTTGR